MYTRLPSPGDNKGAKLTAEELDSISSSFDESLRSPLSGLSPASASLPWFLSAVTLLTIAHSAVRSLIYELISDGEDSLLSWYLDNSMKVLGVCNRICSEIERLCLHHVERKMVMKLLRSEGNPSQELIRQARDLLTDSVGEGEGSSGHVTSGGEVEELIGGLASGIGMLALQGEVSPVDRVVCRAVQAVNFLTAFVAAVISSALLSSSGAVVGLCVPEEFPWGDSLRSIESTIILESRHGEETDRKTGLLKELDDVEARKRHVLEAMDEVVASGGCGEIVGRMREVAAGLEKATESMLKGLYSLRDGVTDLFLTVTKIRKEMLNELRASLWDGQLTVKPGMKSTPPTK
ncbi:hypothetical protein BT93_L4282 [Corymbia citriodora subsp. variegata]|uniref:Uncharacterized protein n=1 Tax=Corymbia citriodora subsp. variegata TaxID=360336 RepID=A0A8T0CUF1_CORYI|nr:hypothetical protein BT93_L4282 [Corymbia citriodora subsp. variegata]